MSNAEMIQKFEEAKKIMALARQKVRACRENLDAVEVQLKAKEAEMLLAISMETNPNGKAKYSNESLREAELIRRKTSDTEYLAMYDLYRTAKREKEEAETELYNAMDDFKFYHTVLSLRTAELKAMPTNEVA